MVSRKEYELIQEGKEPQQFWDSIGGKTEYASSKATLDIREPRLFQCTNAVGYFRIEEVYDFDQEVIPSSFFLFLRLPRIDFFPFSLSSRICFFPSV